MASSPISIPIKSCSGKITGTAENMCKICDYPSGYTVSNFIYLSNAVEWYTNVYHENRFDVVVVLTDSGIYVVPRTAEPIGKNITIYYS